ncbi:uncharacterized protein LOC130728884 [Lotus japonicus]|uniref:uncharacterized protein LOC130728884 n=1 Tax=Lotus japonicus TaxID=34305 RepID=UPI00258B614D|nr:uncharacterized protein LOC130728884 [Lotus japonicus]
MSVASLLSMGGKKVVRRPNVWQAMINELTSCNATYLKLYDINKLYQQVLQALHLASKEIATEEKWLTIPNMGHIVAIVYRVVLVTLSIKGCSTFLPLTGLVPHQSDHKFLCILHVNNNHWVQVHMSSGFPMPNSNPQWRHHCIHNALSWELPYLDRMSRFLEILMEQNTPRSEEF